MLQMHHHPLPFPPKDPVTRAADLMALIRDDLAEHCRRPNFKILRPQKGYMVSDKDIGDLIVDIVKEAHKTIHAPQTSCKRRMSATAVIMQHPFDNKVARLQALMKDDLVDHCRHPSYMMNDGEIADHIVQIVKDAYKQIHVPSPARKRRMSASAVTAGVIMQHPFAEKPLGSALHGFDIGQLKENRDNQLTFNMKDQATGWFHILLSADCQLLPGFHADNMNSLAPLRMFNAIDISELANHVKGSDVLGEKLEDLDMSNPVNHIHLVAEKVRHLRIGVDWSKLFVIDNLGFKLYIKLYLSTIQNIASAIASQFRKKSKRSFEARFIHEGSFDRSWPDILADATQFTEPYADYIMDTRYGYADLTFRNLSPIDPDDRPDRPNKASTFFISAEHHTVALLGRQCCQRTRDA
ncbi:hypothetical protein FPANT_8967 [Fusarium pseudoanthophilum]|uniref:Uncharacterized protein n=1 Tax=Fusarium pseudoanthophilum TaxID=48495 RepID=A0A8H5KVH9_9HYPO|nr:hypothetical protein FPANT_8967 [Fusarium pseudoanthophilum]